MKSTLLLDYDLFIYPFSLYPVKSIKCKYQDYTLLNIMFLPSTPTKALNVNRNDPESDVSVVSVSCCKGITMGFSQRGSFLASTDWPFLGGPVPVHHRIRTPLIWTDWQTRLKTLPSPLTHLRSQNHVRRTTERKRQRTRHRHIF